MLSKFNYIAKRCKTLFDLPLVCLMATLNLNGLNLTVFDFSKSHFKKVLLLKCQLSTNPHPVKHIFSPNSFPLCHLLESNKRNVSKV